MSSHTGRSYVPAAGKDWRLPYYDLIARVFGADRIRRVLVRRAAPAAGERILDIGTGTGAVALELKRHQPAAEVTGMDPDPRALDLARAKARRGGFEVRFDEGFADALPYPEGSFDLVTSSLMFHHLPKRDRLNALREVLRVLRPGGRFHMVDFDGPALFHGGLHRLIARRIHGHAQPRQAGTDGVVEMMREAGFADACIAERGRTWAADMAYYAATRPGRQA